jgi:cytidine diphosphoramidate kinase
MVIWIIGLSGAGKTTLGKALVAAWRQNAPNTVLVDGDEIRKLFRQDVEASAYELDGRRRNAERMVALCEWLDRQDMNVVCCILSLFQEMRDANRARFSRYFEVYLDAPLEALIQRDQKNLYAPALRGETRNVVGVDIPFAAPLAPDLTIETGGSLGDVDRLARRVLAQALPQ